jgi:hypothetical protein
LLDSDLPDNDETQIEDAPEQPWFRFGFNPALSKQYLAAPDIVDALGVASSDALKEILSGYAPSSHARQVLAHFRKGTRYSEVTGAVEYDSFVREAQTKEREAARLVDLARRAYRKMNAVCKAHNASVTISDFEGPLPFRHYHAKREPVTELAAHFGLIPADNRHDTETQTCAHELLEPLLHFDEAARFLNDGHNRAQSGRELHADEAFALLEKYLGISDYKTRAAETVKTLKNAQPKYREKRREQALKMVLEPIFKDVEKNIHITNIWPSISRNWALLIVAFCTIVFFNIRDVKAIVQKHVSDRKSRPDLNRLEAELALCLTDGGERRRILARARKRRSRVKQSTDLNNSRVDVGLRSGGNLQKGA